jgi:outer membrane protein TolC
MRNKFFILALAIQIFACGGIAFGAEPSGSSSPAQRSFTLDQAIQTALQQNPAILTARQEIRRTKGVFIQVLSQALPHITATDQFQRTDPRLGQTNFGTGTGSGGGGGSSGLSLTDNSYFLRVQTTQLIFSGSVFPAIRGADFQHDSAFFGFRNAIDQTITTVRQQFYQVILNKALIGVQEESIRLLESQLKDQQNRFEAGTVPRFNVLQAEVALANQQPSLIAARNNFRISQLAFARTLGLDFDPRRGEDPGIVCKGELTFQPRVISLEDAIQIGKERRPFLKQQKANVQNQRNQLGVAYGGFFPTINADSAYEWQSSPFTSDISQVSKGWFWGATGTWNIFDGLATVGLVKQQRALLSESEITYDDDVRQVEVEIQTAYANLQRDRETIESQEKTTEQAKEALRLASARLGAGAGTQLDVLNAQVALTQAASTELQALYSYNADLAEFDRATATQTIYSDLIDVNSKPATSKTTPKPQSSTTSKKTTTEMKKATEETTSTPTPTPSPRRTY